MQTHIFPIKRYKKTRARKTNTIQFHYLNNIRSENNIHPNDEKWKRDSSQGTTQMKQAKEGDSKTDSRKTWDTGSTKKEFGGYEKNLISHPHFSLLFDYPASIAQIVRSSTCLICPPTPIILFLFFPPGRPPTSRAEVGPIVHSR